MLKNQHSDRGSSRDFEKINKYIGVEKYFNKYYVLYYQQEKLWLIHVVSLSYKSFILPTIRHNSKRNLCSTGNLQYACT